MGLSVCNGLVDWLIVVRAGDPPGRPSLRTPHHLNQEHTRHNSLQASLSLTGLLPKSIFNFPSPEAASWISLCSTSSVSLSWIACRPLGAVDWAGPEPGEGRICPTSWLRSIARVESGVSRSLCRGGEVEGVGLIDLF